MADKPIGKTGFVMREVIGIGIANVQATVTMPEPLFIELVEKYAQAAYDSTPVADIFNEVRALGEKYGDAALGEKMVRVAQKALSSVWGGPCTDIKVLTGAEAVRRRPSFYGLTDEALAGMSDDDLDAVALTVEAEHFVARMEAAGRCVQCAHPWYDGMCGCGAGAADDEGHDLLRRICEHPRGPEILESLP